MNREELQAKIDALIKARQSLCDRIFDEGRLPSSAEWPRIEAFDDKIEGLYKILEKFYPPEQPPKDTPAWVKAVLY